MAVSLPSLRQLRQFVALAEHAHFGRAAAACHVTQSTLSAGIKELETTLGATLVDRTKRHVVLTPLGREILERARRILQDAEDLVRAAEAGRTPLSGQLQFGVIPTIGPFLLPRILPARRGSRTDAAQRPAPVRRDPHHRAVPAAAHPPPSAQGASQAAALSH
jgi:LysR family transcriptional regulator, hydrogen peroxide-inducible genes activator